MLHVLPVQYFIIYYHMIYPDSFASDVQHNPWIREAMNAARNKSCVAFYCFEDYQQSSNGEPQQ